MSAPINRQLVVKTLPPTDRVGPEHFELREAAIPTPAEGEVLVRTLVLSCDPTQRGWLNEVRTYVPAVKVGDVMPGWSVAQVVTSNKPGFAPGDIVWGTLSWQDYVSTNGAGIFPLRKLERGVPITYPLGVTGITGVTAYIGMLDLAAPAAGETVVVSAAAGATGSIAAQLAKLRGARVIGIAGGPEKCAWLTHELGLDAAIDYKEGDIKQRLRELCPSGVDVYFDNVGGSMLDLLLQFMRVRSRIVLCGMISHGHGRAPMPSLASYPTLMFRSVTVRGLLIFHHMERFDAASEELYGWVRSGQIIAREDVLNGLENAPLALARLFEGKNIGKQLVKVADPDLQVGTTS